MNKVKVSRYYDFNYSIVIEVFGAYKLTEKLPNISDNPDVYFLSIILD